MMSEGAAERLDTSVEVERLVGTACGITIEVLTCAERRKVLLVASPTKWGVTVLAEGALHDADTFARVGACVLRALADVVPLITGEAFRGPMARDGVAAAVR